MAAVLVWPSAEKRKRPLSGKSCGIIALPWAKKKRKIKTKMEGQCKDRPGVERADGGRRDRPKQVTTTRTLQANLATTGTVKDLTTPRNIFHDLYATRYKI